MQSVYSPDPADWGDSSVKYIVYGWSSHLSSMIICYVSFAAKPFCLLHVICSKTIFYCMLFAAKPFFFFFFFFFFCTSFAAKPLINFIVHRKKIFFLFPLFKRFDWFCLSFLWKFFHFFYFQVVRSFKISFLKTLQIFPTMSELSASLLQSWVINFRHSHWSHNLVLF